MKKFLQILGVALCLIGPVQFLVMLWVMAALAGDVDLGTMVVVSCVTGFFLVVGGIVSFFVGDEIVN